MAEPKFKKYWPKNGQKESFKGKQYQKPQNLFLMDKRKFFFRKFWAQSWYLQTTPMRRVASSCSFFWKILISKSMHQCVARLWL